MGLSFTSSFELVFRLNFQFSERILIKEKQPILSPFIIKGTEEGGGKRPALGLTPTLAFFSLPAVHY